MARRKPNQNDQTWVKVKRLELRRLAALVGDEALTNLKSWPANGDGRLVKEITERISRRLADTQVSLSLGKLIEQIDETLMEFESILRNRFFIEHMGLVPVKASVGSRPLRNYVEDIILDIRDDLYEIVSALPSGPTPAEQLQDLTPRQRTGPLRFEVRDGLLTIQHQAANIEASDRRNAESALTELLHTGNALTSYFETSNVDRHLREMIKDIVDRLVSRQDIIQIGIAAIGCQIVVDRLSEELPDFWAARTKGFALGLGMYVAQHAEWQKFSEKSSLADYSQDDVRVLYHSGIQLVTKLRAAPEGVDPEVPRTLSFLLETIQDPGRALKRTVYAAITSIENMVIVIVRACGGIIGAIPEGAQEGVKVATKASVAAALLLIAGTVATQIAPAAGHVLQTNWLKEAGKIILESVKAAD